MQNFRDEIEILRTPVIWIFRANQAERHSRMKLDRGSERNFSVSRENYCQKVAADKLEFFEWFFKRINIVDFQSFPNSKCK